MALACVSTAKSPAAIAVVEVFADGAADIVRSIFKTDSGKVCPFDVGEIYTGYISDGEEIIDHVVAARTGNDVIEISCHGNPLIVEMVMGALKKAGAKLVNPEEMITAKLAGKGNNNTIQIEAQIAKLKSLSLAGVKAICNSNLHEVASGWIERIDSLDIEEVKAKCNDILTASRSAGYLIHGVKAVIAGPPNSGKSTLLNCLCGRQKAIVTDIAGTTRDWVSGTCKAGELTIEFFDTAGLDASIIGQSQIDAESQKRSMEILNQCDIVLLVLDPTQPGGNFNFDIITQSGKKIIKIHNKSDLGKSDQVDSINISAMTGKGIDRLLDLITDELIGKDRIAETICFTERQTGILQQICKTDNIKEIKKLIRKLVGQPGD